MASAGSHLGRVQGAPTEKHNLLFRLPRGHRAGPGRSRVKTCFMSIKYESTACYRAEGGSIWAPASSLPGSDAWGYLRFSSGVFFCCWFFFVIVYFSR